MQVSDAGKSRLEVSVANECACGPFPAFAPSLRGLRGGDHKEEGEGDERGTKWRSQERASEEKDRFSTFSRGSPPRWKPRPPHFVVSWPSSKVRSVSFSRLCSSTTRTLQKRPPQRVVTYSSVETLSANQEAFLSPEKSLGLSTTCGYPFLGLLLLVPYL